MHRDRRHVPSRIIVSPNGRGHAVTEAYTEIACQGGALRVYPDRLVSSGDGRGYVLQKGRTEIVQDDSGRRRVLR